MSTLHVENLKGLSSGGNANKIIVPSGQELTAQGHVIQFAHADSNTNTTWSQSNTRSALYGTGMVNRAYVEGASLTITPKSTSNILYCTASIGWSNFNPSTTQANGSIITLNDTTSGTLNLSDVTVALTGTVAEFKAGFAGTRNGASAR